VSQAVVTSSSVADSDAETADVVVVGAGFGGLGAALRLAEGGARVVLLESLTYPGGCASTFRHRGYQFEAGATLSSGLGEGQLFRSWIDRHGLDVVVDPLDPVIEYRTEGVSVDLPSDPDTFVDRLAALPGTDPVAARSFLGLQRRVGDLLWGLLDDPALLPPFGPGGLLGHLRRAPKYAALLPLIGRPLGRVLADHGLGDAQAFRQLLDSLCQITIQCSAEEAETPFALSTMDYTARGTAHVRGGIGRLAEALVQGIRGAGGDVRYASRARALERRGGDWIVATSRGSFRAPHVVMNLLPQNVGTLLGDAADKQLAPLTSAVEDGWGAAMLYLVVRPPEGQADRPHHLELVADADAEKTSGNHVFASISGPEDAGRAPEGLRTMTVSTHVPMRTLRSLDAAERGAYIADIQVRMRRTLERRAPEWLHDVVFEATASPRTFERFTGRFLGYVGGVPRRAGLHHYRRLGPSQPRPGLWLVGDSVFPGQSTLATALGGVKTAEAVLA
jgi:phytoene dehydrogenase-like protein